MTDRFSMSSARLGRYLLLGVAASALCAGAAQAEPLDLTILLVNDFDRMDESDGQGGFARMMAVVNDEIASAEGGTVLLAHGGDAISPSLLSSFDNGAHMIELLNQTPLAVMVPGNHEFDLGADVAIARFNEANFPIVSTNTSLNGEVVDGTVDTHTVEVGGYTIGFLGLTTPDTVQLASPGDIEFAPVLETAEATAAELREGGADIVIALAHTAIDEDFELIRQGAVDIILGGHDHNLMTFYNGDVAFAESGSQAEYVTAIDLTIDRVGEGEDEELVWTPSFRTLNTANYEPDAEMAAKVQTYLDQLSAELDIEIGTTETPLDSRRATIRGEEAAIGNLIADAIRDAVDAEVGLTNGGGIRADREYAAGTVLTRRDIQSELPFGNKTVKLEVTGEQIVEALENGFSQVEEGAGRFPHVSGMTVTADLSQPPGDRVVEVLVDGQPIDPDATYTMATNDYMASGGDGYTALAGSVNLIDPSAANFMASQVIDYIEEKGTISPEVEGRIVFQ
ncbi:5'-nucleotidase C-terminal domain-containing protein [Inquilinus sp. CAU 1745]|uniref:bifunctional metallophosphatase/5'-nucleotidase n=1 Tax=Inquilinus sp. CAU 1745 TaxID=3140369 RepID=UPI00325BE76C